MLKKIILLSNIYSNTSLEMDLFLNDRQKNGRLQNVGIQDPNIPNIT